MSFSLRIALTFTAVSAICVTAAGCGGGGDPLAGLTAKQVLSRAVSDLKSAPSFRMAGAVNENGRISVDLTYQRGTGCEGTLGLGSQGSVYLLVIHTTAWFKPDQAYWTSVAGSAAPSVIAVVGGKYLQGTTAGSNGASGLAHLCDAGSLASSFTTPSDIAKGAATTINGQQVLELKDPAKSSTMFVTDTGSPQILRVTSSQSGNSGRVDFTDYGSPVTLTPPPASETIDGTKYGF